MLAGPYCGMLLADLGAEVLKVEMGEGDIARSIGRFSVSGHNVYFASLNRNKKSVLLDLTDAQDRVKFNDLVQSADALITNLRPAAIRKLGLTYDELSKINPRIVTVALTGFGLTGPYSDYPAYDYIIQAMVGVMLLTGEPGASPTRVGYSVVDNTSGMMAAIGLLAKLVEGKGGQVDISLYDSLLSQLNYIAAAWMNGGERPGRVPGGGHNYFVPAQIFASRDGHIALFVTHDDFWAKFATIIGRTDWLTDPRFATMGARSENRDFVIADIQQELLRRTSSDWVELLQPAGIVIAAVGTLEDALDCEHVRSREMVVSVSTPDGPLHMTGNPIKVEGSDQSYRLPPLLGEHAGFGNRDGND